MSKKYKNYIAFYGNVKMLVKKCPYCKDSVFVVDNKYQCCGRKVKDEKIEGFVQKCESKHKRAIKDSVKKQLLEEQGGRCFYCDVTFGSIRFRNGNPIVIKVHYDHKVPYIYRNDNNDYNIVASCHVCNFCKSSKIFNTVDEARFYLAERRKQKGYDF